MPDDQEFTSMPSPEPSSAGESIDSHDTSSMERGAAEITERRGEDRAAEKPTVEVRYNRTDKPSERFDEKWKLEGPAGIERAAKDLGRFREGIGEQVQANERGADQRYADAVRNGLTPGEAAKYATQQTQPQAGQQQQPVQPQQQAVEWPTNANQPQPQPQTFDWSKPEDVLAAKPLVADLQAQAWQRMDQIQRQIVSERQLGHDTSKLLEQYNQLGAEINQGDHIQRIIAGVESGLSIAVSKNLADPETYAFVQKYASQMATNFDTQIYNLWTHACENVTSASAAVMAGCPELQGYEGNPNQVAAVVATIERHNPARAAQIRQNLASFQTVLQHKQQLEQQFAERRRQEFTQYANREDAKYASWNPDSQSPETGKRVASEVMDFLNGHGMSDDDIKLSYASDPTFRSAIAQTTLKYAAAYFAATRGVQSSRVRPTPPSAPIRGTGDRVGNPNNPQRQPSSYEGNPGLKQAAAFLAQRRSSR